MDFTQLSQLFRERYDKPPVPGDCYSEEELVFLYAYGDGWVQLCKTRELEADGGVMEFEIYPGILVEHPPRELISLVLQVSFASSDKDRGVQTADIIFTILTEAGAVLPQVISKSEPVPGAVVVVHPTENTSYDVVDIGPVIAQLEAMAPAATFTEMGGGGFVSIPTDRTIVVYRHPEEKQEMPV